MLGMHCRHCGRSLGPHRTRRAEYCTDRCRAAAVYLRKRLETLAATHEHLCALLQDEAPDGAIGYRLLLQEGGTLWRYPPSRGRRWVAIDGQPCQRGFFSLWPFELPVVPRSAVYGVQFVSRRHVYRTPPPLLSGVAVDPVRAMRLEEGEEL